VVLIGIVGRPISSRERARRSIGGDWSPDCAIGELSDIDENQMSFFSACTDFAGLSNSNSNGT
jgi:hypothetical protein